MTMVLKQLLNSNNTGYGILKAVKYCKISNAPAVKPAVLLCLFAV